MVAGGNLVVGLVVFLIITVVQFMVIAKGSERVAVVVARFSLDAMPGKQMSIDSDLRSGLIDKDEARRRRKLLELESKLHGSLDGAMKFVKGDSIAGIIIIMINLIGGLTVGVLQQGMPISEAMTTYSILTIGDGLVAQIPALMGAMSAGLLVTRATDEDNRSHLGEAIRSQVVGQPRVLIVTGGICGLLALVPGFPLATFAVLGSLAAGSGLLLTERPRRVVERWLRPVSTAMNGALHLPSPPASPLLAAPAPALRPVVPLLIELPARIMELGERNAMIAAFEAMLDRIQYDMGIAMPRLSVHLGGDLQTNGWRLLAYEVEVASGRDARDMQALVAQVETRLRRRLALFVGMQEVTGLVMRAEVDYPNLVKELMRQLTVPRLSEIFRQLIEEQVTLRPLRELLEGLCDASQREKDSLALAEYGRVALRQHIMQRIAPGRQLRAAVLDSALEAKLRESLTLVSGVPQLSLRPEIARNVINMITETMAHKGLTVLLTSVDLRRHMWKLVAPDMPTLSVISFFELTPEVNLDVIARIAVNGEEPQIAEAAE